MVSKKTADRNGQDVEPLSLPNPTRCDCVGSNVGDARRRVRKFIRGARKLSGSMKQVIATDQALRS